MRASELARVLGARQGLGPGALLLCITLTGATACGGGEEQSPAELQRLTVEVVHTYPHAVDAHTQGLEYRDGELLESTGIEGESQLRKVDLESGEVLEAVDLEPSIFGEGLAIDGDRAVQLSYHAGRAFVWDLTSMTLQGEYAYEGDGWGLCHDGEQFVMSDGTDVLQLRDSETFELTGTVKVQLDMPLLWLRLNELECVDGDVYANLYMYREIVRISMPDGRATAWIDTRNLLLHPDVAEGTGNEALDLNGIAHVADGDRFLLTGKYWPRVFEVRWIPDTLFGVAD